ncbi:MAG: prolyl oligopeptidase family serine peptidase [Fuerstiella sp.]
MLLFALLPREELRAQTALPSLTEIAITSTLDGTDQPTLYWAPASAASQPTPLFIFLHSWSGNYRQDNSKWQRHAVNHGWIYLHPNFRGVNNTPPACGSKLARQDILDAMDDACRRFQVDRSRIYLAGVSGGGHMAMLMAGHHPERFSAVSAWVGISDLAEWYRFHLKDGRPQNYARMILGSLGAPPGTNPDTDAEYRDRSPLFHLHRVGDLPVDIFAGVNDGHTGSVPVRHSLTAFNEIAGVHGSDLVTEEEMQSLWNDRRLPQPRPSDKEKDATLGRDILLRRTAGNSRVTIFEGGHESIPEAAVEWLSHQQRSTSE